jgi:ATP-dependent Clp protease protease subunit
MIEIAIPEALENLQLPNPELLDYYTNLQERKMWIDYEIDSSLFEVTRSILRWNKEDEDKKVNVEDRVPIKLFIHSPGGEADATISLANICLLSKTPIYTYNMGIAMSGGFLILLGGHKRFCLDGTRAMVHSGSNDIAGTGEQVEAAAKDYKRLIDYMQSFVLKRTGMDAKTFGKYKKTDWYLNSDEQVKYGVVHSIIKDISQLL